MSAQPLPRPLSSSRANRFPSSVAALLVACALGLPAQQDKDRERKPPPPAKPAAEPHREAKPEPRREARPETPRPEPRREARPETPRREPRTETPRPEVRREMQMEPRRDPTPMPGARGDRTPTPRKEVGTRPGPVRETTPREAVPHGGAPRDGHADRPGGFFDPRPGPAREVVKVRGGGEIHRTPGGAIREVRTSGGVVIRHAPSGVRLVEVARPGGRIIVANATGRRGYLQRPLVVHNHSFVQRTYILNGVPRARIYRPWVHAGWTYHVYAPVVYYRPAFYSWCYTPWRRPVRYVWGWESRPWYGYYGGYFTPYRSYVSPSYWLADFLLATTLEAAYLAQRASVEAPPVTYSTATALTPEVKDAIADEVRRQMDLERAERDARDDRDDATPALFSERGPRVFVVSNPLMASSDGQECALSEGDVLELNRRPSPSSEFAEVRVLSSRSGNCARGSRLTVRCTDLQEMQNHLRATLGDGMSTLQKEQGRNGLPTLPKDVLGTDRTAYADEVRPDADAVEQITQAAQEANRAEQDLINQGPQDPGGAAGAATISLGMTFEEVERVLGRPRNTADLGAKKIYVYKDLKITFLNGKVSDVQ